MKRDNNQSDNGDRSVLYGCITFAVMSWIQMGYGFDDPRDFEIDRVKKHLAYQGRRMRVIL